MQQPVSHLKVTPATSCVFFGLVAVGTVIDFSLLPRTLQSSNGPFCTEVSIRVLYCCRCASTDLLCLLCSMTSSSQRFFGDYLIMDRPACHSRMSPGRAPGYPWRTRPMKLKAAPRNQHISLPKGCQRYGQGSRRRQRIWYACLSIRVRQTHYQVNRTSFLLFKGR